MRRRHAEVVAALRSTREIHRDAADTAQRALIEVAGLERDERSSADEHERARSRREQASVAFRQLAQAGILQLALREATPADAATAGSWTATRTLEVARGLPSELLAVRTGSGEQAVEVQRAVQLLDRELAEADMAAYATRGQDGLLLVQVTDAGGEQTLPQMLETLSAEIADREQILTAEERRVFTDALVEEIADHLRQRIHEVRGRVERMNAVLHRSPTAAGKTVELEWRPLEHDDGIQQTALALLRRDVRHLGEEARGQLGGVLPGQDRRCPPGARVRRAAPADGRHADGGVRLPGVVRLRHARARPRGPRPADQAPPCRRLRRRAVGAHPPPVVRGGGGAVRRLAGAPADHARRGAVRHRR